MPTATSVKEGKPVVTLMQGREFLFRRKEVRVGKRYEVRGHGLLNRPISRVFTSREAAIRAARLSLSYEGHMSVTARWADGSTAVYWNRSAMDQDQTGEKSAYLVVLVEEEGS